MQSLLDLLSHVCLEVILILGNDQDMSRALKQVWDCGMNRVMKYTFQLMFFKFTPKSVSQQLQIELWHIRHC